MNPILQICQLFCKTGRTQFALKFLQELQGSLGDPNQIFVIGLCYQEISEFEKAIEIYNKCFDHMQNKDQILSCLSICHANLLQIDKAESFLSLCNDRDFRRIADANLKRVKAECQYLASDNGYWHNHNQHTSSTTLSYFIAQTLTNDRKVYDFGCGDGSYLAVLQQFGFLDLIGFEGCPSENAKFKGIKAQDLSVPFNVPEKGHVICLEVAEHIPRKHEKTLVSNLANACNGYLILSWAIRGQGGTCHVNCRNNDEVLDMILPHGFVFHEDLTMQARSRIEDYCYWFKDTILVFSSKKEAQDGNQLCSGEA